jgi:RNA polymerase sigma factor (sigma-70 family)
MNQNEFMQLIIPFKDKVFRLAQRLLVSREEAEDATQEVLVKLWTRNESLAGFNSVEAFAMTMTKNYCLDQLKSKRTENIKIVANDFAHSQPSLDKRLEDSDSLDWVEKIINELPEQQRLIVQLRDIEQYEFTAIAAVVEMNETAIRVALSRARKTIREKMIKMHSYGMG